MYWYAMLEMKCDALRVITTFFIRIIMRANSLLYIDTSMRENISVDDRVSGKSMWNENLIYVFFFWNMRDFIA